MKWRKNAGDVWTTRVGPYAVKVGLTGDLRWNWSITKDDKPNPEATGVRASLGAAKTACEQFVKRSGYE